MTNPDDFPHLIFEAPRLDVIGDIRDTPEEPMAQTAQPPDAFDIVAIQSLNGAIVGTLRHNVPAPDAFHALIAERLDEHGAGVFPCLIPLDDALYQLRRELERAREQFAAYNSAHEAYAVILEELEEFWAWVKVKREARDREAMRAELIQIAATAIRAVEDLGL